VGQVWKRPIAATADVTPRSVYRKDVQTQLVSALLFGLVGGIAAGLTAVPAVIGIGVTQLDTPFDFVSVAVSALSAGVIVGAVFALIGGLRDGATPLLFCTQLAFAMRGRPVRFLPLLEEARERQILRQAGAVYQFRHADLQDRLAEQQGAP
jgi:hypothetical protein